MDLSTNPQMQQQQQPERIRMESSPCCSSSSLRVTIYVLGALSLLVWGNCIGFTLGYAAYASLILYGSIVSIPVNVGYIYVTCRIIFLISDSTTVTPKALVDLQRLNARLVALILVGFSVWVTGVVWFALYYPGNSYYNDELVYDAFMTFFATNFGFIFAALVVGFSAGLQSQWKKVSALRPAGLLMHESPPKYYTGQGPAQVLLDQGLDAAPPPPWPSNYVAQY
ncbi:uncharacterized protein [Procambarus clarkii]|uniref:uncharacterized protein isoform X1 n=2 Tax=Procambarus clarkii TaxID=6728 RepID=UPI003743D453